MDDVIGYYMVLHVVSLWEGRTPLPGGGLLVPNGAEEWMLDGLGQGLSDLRIFLQLEDELI